MTCVLLITGARSLATRPGAEAWARAKIAEALAGCDLLIVGDADGPDAWAWEIAESQWFDPVRGQPNRVHRRRIHCYATQGSFTGDVILHDGFPVGGGRFAVETESRWAATKRPRGGEDLRQWLLSRNVAMIDEALTWHRSPVPHYVSVLALLDGLKVDVPARDGKRGVRATRGTEHTVGLARAAGLTVREEVWRGTSKGATP
jgi:hypothetical protein